MTGNPQGRVEAGSDSSRASDAHVPKRGDIAGIREQFEDNPVIIAERLKDYVSSNAPEVGGSHRRKNI